jgi:hypothetical protein
MRTRKGFEITRVGEFDGVARRDDTDDHDSVPIFLVARPPVVLIEYAALHSVIEKKVRRNK